MSEGREDELQEARELFRGGDFNAGSREWLNRSQGIVSFSKDRELIIGSKSAGRKFSTENRKATKKIIGSAKNSKELLAGYSLFSLAPVYLSGTRFSTINFVDDFCCEAGEDVDWRYLEFQNRVIHGCKTPDGKETWGHTIFCMPSVAFNPFRFYTSGIVAILKKGIQARPVWQEVTIPDPVTLDKGGVAEPVVLNVMAVIIDPVCKLHVCPELAIPGFWLRRILMQQDIYAAVSL